MCGDFNSSSINLSRDVYMYHLCLCTLQLLPISLLVAAQVIKDSMHNQNILDLLIANDTLGIYDISVL